MYSTIMYQSWERYMMHSIIKDQSSEKYIITTCYQGSIMGEVYNA